ncbi:MAG: DUF2281 domain-containing protein [Pyrinomonadaceae bacterium]
MQTFEVTILEPKAETMLDDMESKKLVKLSKPKKNGIEKKPLQFGSMKGLVLYIAEDFDAPLEDFEEYM